MSPWALIEFGASGWQANPYSGGVIPPPAPGPAYLNFGCGALIDTVTTYADDTDFEDQFFVLPPVPTPLLRNGSCSYSGSMSIEVEEWFEVIAHVPRNSDGFPLYGGSPGSPWAGFAVPDGPKSYKIRYFECTKEGGAIEAQISFPGAAASVAGTIADVYPLDTYRVHVVIDQTVEGMYSVTHSGTITMNGVPCGSPNSEFIDSDTWNFDGGFLLISSPEPGGLKQLGCEVGLGPPREYWVSAQLRQFEEPYDSEQEIRIKTGFDQVDAFFDVIRTADPNVTEQVTQRDAAGFYVRNFSRFHSFFDIQIGGCSMYLENPNAEPGREDYQDWRILVSGVPFDICDLRQKNPFELAQINDASWDLNGGTASNTSPYAGVRQDDVSAPIVLTYTGDPVSFLGYRYVRVPVVISGGSVAGLARLRTAGKVFEAEFTHVSTFIEFDLLAPLDREPAVQTQETTWPLGSDADWQSTFGVGDYGAELVLEVDLGSTAPEISFSALNLVIKDRCEWNALSAFSHWQQFSDTHHAKRFIWTDVDGKLGLELQDMMRTSGGTPAYTWLTVYDMLPVEDWYEITAVNEDFPDDYHDPTGDAIWLGGNGAVATGTGSELQWEEFLARDLEEGFRLRAQSLWDEVEGYPLIGNCWDGADYPGAGDSFATKAMPVRVRKYLRWRAWGQAQDEMTGETIRIIDPDDESEAASGPVAADGSFYVGDVRTPKDYRILLDIDEPVHRLVPVSKARYWHRAGFAGSGETGLMAAASAYDASRSHVYSAWGVPGGIEIHRRKRRLNNSLSYPYEPILDLSFSWSYASKALWLAIVRGNGDCVLWAAPAGEATFGSRGEPVLIASGAQRCTHAICPRTGMIVVGVWHPDWGEWRFFARFERTGEPFEAMGTLPVSGNSSDGSLVFGGGSNWHLSFTYFDGTGQKLKRSQDCGATWLDY
jgi:hypothetical protein